MTDLVDYQGSLVDRHGRYRRGGQCVCGECQAMWAGYLADPQGGFYSPDVRWQLLEVGSGAVVLVHVRPESFTRVSELLEELAGLLPGGLGA